MTQFASSSSSGRLDHLPAFLFQHERFLAGLDAQIYGAILRYAWQDLRAMSSPLAYWYECSSRPYASEDARLIALLVPSVYLHHCGQTAYLAMVIEQIRHQVDLSNLTFEAWMSHALDRLSYRPIMEGYYDE